MDSIMVSRMLRIWKPLRHLQTVVRQEEPVLSVPSGKNGVLRGSCLRAVCALARCQAPAAQWQARQGHSRPAPCALAAETDKGHTGR